MGLTQEQIEALLTAEANKPPRGRSKGPAGPDTSQRDYRTWFKLATAMIDEGGEPLRCENPNCIDRRDHTVHIQVCAIVSGRHICRYCFLDGWLLPPESQQTLEL